MPLASGLPGKVQMHPTTKRLQGPPVFGTTTGVGTSEGQGAQLQNIITLRWHHLCWGEAAQDYRSDLMQTFTPGENNILRSLIWVSTAKRYTLLHSLISGRRQKVTKPSLAFQSLSFSENKTSSSTPNGTWSAGNQLWCPQTCHCMYPCPLHSQTAPRRQECPSSSFPSSWHTHEHVATAKNFMTLVSGLTGNLGRTK